MEQDTSTPVRGEHPQAGPMVRITVDAKPYEVHRGSHIVGEFKQEVGIDASYVVDELIDGVFKELADDSRITIKGGEVFISHVRQGGAS